MRCKPLQTGHPRGHLRPTERPGRRLDHEHGHGSRAGELRCSRSHTTRAEAVRAVGVLAYRAGVIPMVKLGLHLVTSAALIAPAGVSAPAGAQPPGVKWICTGHSQPPIAESGILRANAFQSCTGGPGWRMQRLVVEIQRSRWFGWQTMQRYDSGNLNDAFVERTVLYKCAGTGRQTYRTLATGYTSNGAHRSAPVPSPSTLTVTC